MKRFADNFYKHDFAWHLVEDDADEGENETHFDTVDIIKEDSSEHQKVKERKTGKIQTRFRLY